MSQNTHSSISLLENAYIYISCQSCIYVYIEHVYIVHLKYMMHLLIQINFFNNVNVPKKKNLFKFHFCKVNYQIHVKSF